MLCSTTNKEAYHNSVFEKDLRLSQTIYHSTNEKTNKTNPSNQTTKQ